MAQKECGFYECKNVETVSYPYRQMNRIPCPECEAEIDYEIGPDESMEDALDTAELLEKIIGEEEVEKMDGLLSLGKLPVETVTGFNFRLKVLNGWLGKTNEVCYNRNME